MTTPPNPAGHDGRPRCGGPKRQTDGVCTQHAGWGTDHPGFGRCKLHGGSTPSHSKAALVEMARQAVETYGLPRDIDPAQALLEEVARTAGHVAWLGEKIREIEPEALVWGRSKAEKITASEYPGTNVTIAAEVNVWLELYRAERKHLVDVSKAAIAAKIDERRVRLAEQHGALLADVLRAVLADPELGMSVDQRRAVPAVIRRHLAAV